VKYSIILPVYNEAQNIFQIYKRTKNVLRKLRNTHEFILINDGSRDTSFIQLQKLHRQDKTVKIINFSRNFGHQTAVTAGLQFAQGKYVAILDADLQDPPEVLPEFFNKLEEGYDTVYAIRRKRKEHIVKRFLYSTFYRLLKFISTTDIPLDSGDFCVMNSRVVRAINSLPERNRFIRGIRSWVGFKSIGIEYERAARYAGNSKYTYTKLMKLAFDGLFSFSYVPLQLMFAFGLISLAFSFIGILIVFYLRFFTNTLVPGFATTIILVLFIGGLQLFSFGIVGEYVRRIYDEIKQRPQYIIESLVGIKYKH